LRAIVLSAVLVALATPALAARIVQVRVGKHPTFSRVVFELDSHVGYQVESRSASGAEKVLAVTLDAASRDREVISKSLGVGSVRVEEVDGKAVATVTLRKSGLTMKEMILSNPPRIVLDFEHAPVAAAVVPKPATTAKAKPPTPEKAAAPVAKKPVAKKPAAKKPAAVAKSTPAVAPRPSLPVPTAKPKIASAKPETAKPKSKTVSKSQDLAKVAEKTKVAEKAKPATTAKAKAEVAKAAAKVEPATVAKAEKLPAPELDKPAPITPKPLAPLAQLDPPKSSLNKSLEEMDRTANSDRAAIREMTPGVHKREGLPGRKPGEEPGAMVEDMASVVAGAKSATSSAGAAGMESAPKPAQPKPAAPRKVAKASKTAAAAPASESSSIDPMMIAAIVGGVALVAVIAFMLVRRRTIPKNLDVTQLSSEIDDDDDIVDPPLNEDEASEGGLDGRIPSAGFEMTEPVAAASEAMDEPVANTDPADSEPRVAEENTAAYSLSEVSANAPEDDPSAGLFDDDDEGEKAMDMESNDLPAAREEFAAASAPTIGAAAGDSSDVAAMVQQLVSRVDALESKLEESNDARDRLERQVAAQSEELRVQRAAIARTQRALRSLNRTEDEQATEPALRDPS
jgi:Meckel syndrome type 1 protein